MAEIRTYYFIILAIAFVLPSTPGVYIVLPLWVISIIHGLKVRAAYLIQLDVFKQTSKQERMKR